MRRLVGILWEQIGGKPQDYRCECVFRNKVKRLLSYEQTFGSCPLGENNGVAIK